jgi:hypothetical protein
MNFLYGMVWWLAGLAGWAGWAGWLAGLAGWAGWLCLVWARRKFPKLFAFGVDETTFDFSNVHLV